jgi:hypothetical protein
MNVSEHTMEEELNPAPTARQALRILSMVLRLLAAAFVIILVILSAVTLDRVATQSDQLVKISQSNEALNKVMLDCTQPTGKCFKDGQARTGVAIQNINEVTIAASYCAKTVPQDSSIAVLRNCIERELAKAK